MSNQIEKYNIFKNYILFSLLVITALIFSMIPLINAEIQSLGNFKQNECVNLIQTCGNCTYVNITSVLYPNSSQVLGETEMTKSGTRYNYTFCSTSVLGTYIVNGVGDSNGVNTIWNYNFFVTTTGVNRESILNNSIFIFLTLIGILLVIAGANMGIPWFGFIGSIMFLFSGIYTMIYGFDNITNLYTQGVSITLIGLGLIFMFSSAYEWVLEVDEGQ